MYTIPWISVCTTGITKRSSCRDAATIVLNVYTNLGENYLLNNLAEKFDKSRDDKPTKKNLILCSSNLQDFADYELTGVDSSYKKIYLPTLYVIFFLGRTQKIHHK